MKLKGSENQTNIKTTTNELHEYVNYNKSSWNIQIPYWDAWNIETIDKNNEDQNLIDAPI
jgi:hypothetical protein